MLRTISVGKYLSIQGIFVQNLADGLGQVRVGTQLFTGRLIGG